jgi:hypothetical protein
MDLRCLGISGWDWPGSSPGEVNKELARQNPRIRRDILEELTEYCWCAYSKAMRGSGDLVIGRVQHLGAAGLYSKVADIAQGGTMFDGAATGNLLKTDKWARVVNDSWVLGGVHRGANFRLVSPLLLENLWNASERFLVVTAREILGLLYFGYQLDCVGPYQVLMPHSHAMAAAADLLKYDGLARNRGDLRHAIDLIGKDSPHAQLMKEITARLRT